MYQNQSKEDYLKAVLTIRSKTGQCRSIDVATHLNLSRASISRAVSKLSEEGLLLKALDGQLVLTDKGEKYADAVENRYQLLKKIFLYLGVSKEKADADACNIEHSVSDETYEKLLEWYQSRIDR